MTEHVDWNNQAARVLEDLTAAIEQARNDLESIARNLGYRPDSAGTYRHELEAKARAEHTDTNGTPIPTWTHT